MSILIPEDSETLRMVCPEWDFANPPENATELATLMYTTMRMENGVGLAAPQIGRLYRVFVMGDELRFATCFNPEIISTSDEQVIAIEGCLSFPGLEFKVKRWAEIEVRYWTAAGELKEETLTGLWSKCFQHELDHLNGICFVDRVGAMTLNLAKKRRSKFSKGA
jgi:peptide deformylase